MAKIAEIRSLFEAKIKDGIPDPPGSFDPRDLERVKSDKYLYRVLEHSRNNVQQAVEMLYEIMVWRKNMNANDVNENSVNIDYLREGIFFPQGRDIDSCLIFIMKSKLYHKGQKNIDEVKKVIIYWLERIEREEDGKKITLFFDMDGCGLNNMDIEIIMYLVTLLKNYYPNLINYIIIFQLPWMLSAGFKIVKGILPAEAIERLRMVNRDKLKDLVASEQALVSWGGKNDYVFKFFPENRVNVDTTPKNASCPDSQHSLGEMLSLNPGKLLIFKIENEQICAQLTITNMDESVISFKIRTTAPEKYVVKPSSGILACQSSQTIRIQVNSGFQINSVEKDRFLVVSMQIPNPNVSPKELSDMWKTVGSKADEYRLICSTVNAQKMEPIREKPDLEQDSIVYKLNNLQNNHKMLVQNLKTLKMYQFFTLILTILSIGLGFFTYSNITSFKTRDDFDI